MRGALHKNYHSSRSHTARYISSDGSKMTAALSDRDRSSPKKTSDALSEAEFKSAMRRLAATVSLVTTIENDEFFGMTATSIASLSAEPPSLLVCINRDASMHDPALRSGFFCVNMLGDDQVDVCRNFGQQKGARRFDVGSWTQGPHGLPYIRGATAVLFCAAETHFTYSTHTIFVGRIEKIVVDRPSDPLIYQSGQMGRFQPLNEGRAIS